MTVLDGGGCPVALQALNVEITTRSF